MGNTVLAKSGCPYVTSVCGKNRDLTNAEEEGIAAVGVPAGEVCAYSLDPTVRKPIINLNGDD